MRGDVGVVGLRLDALAVLGEVVPVEQHRRERSDEPVARRDGALAGQAGFRLQAAQHGAAGPQHVHGVRLGGQQFERGLELVGQPAQFREQRAVLGQLRAGGQVAVEEQVGDFLKPGLGGKVFDSVAAVGEAEAFLADGADGRFTGVDPGETAGFAGFGGVAHGDGSFAVEGRCGGYSGSARMFSTCVSSSGKSSVIVCQGVTSSIVS